MQDRQIDINEISERLRKRLWKEFEKEFSRLTEPLAEANRKKFDKMLRSQGGAGNADKLQETLLGELAQQFDAVSKMLVDKYMRRYKKLLYFHLATMEG